MALNESTVALIAEQRAAGLKSHEIATALNELGIRTSGGSAWTAGNVGKVAVENGLTKPAKSPKATEASRIWNGSTSESFRAANAPSGAARNVRITNRWVGIEEAAELLGITPTEAWNIARFGHIKSWFPGTGDGARMFLRVDVLKYRDDAIKHRDFYVINETAEPTEPTEPSEDDAA